MRLHVVSLPHTRTTRQFDHCAYTAKVRKFCDMMTPRGHEVFLYSPEGNEANCTEHINCLSLRAQEDLFSEFAWWREGRMFEVDWDDELPYWTVFNAHVNSALKKRVQPRDLLCFITGWSQRKLMDNFPKHLRVEFGVGYPGIHAAFRAFESYAWMHSVYGQRFGAGLADGVFFDAVIPNYYDVSEFPRSEPDDYLLFMSRWTPRKGYQIALDIAERSGLKLVVAGTQDPGISSVEYVGLADAGARGELMSKARAVLVPTLYLEPFGGVAAESLLCGTPVITTDWGAFVEYVETGADGFRCRTMKQFVDAVDRVQSLDREAIQRRARLRFGFDTVGAMYEDYFNRLLTLWGDGFYER